MGNACNGCFQKEIISDGNNTGQPSSKPIINFEEIEETKSPKGAGRKSKPKIAAVTWQKVKEVNEAVTAVISARPKSSEDINMILNALNSHFILRNLDEDSQRHIIDQMKHFSVNSGEIITQQGFPGKYFFVLATGRLEVIVNGIRQNVLKPGTGFGELALLDDKPRTATVKSAQKSTLWGVDRLTFKQAVEAVNRMNYEENKLFINSVPIFEILTSQQKEALLASITTQKWDNRQAIVKEGEVGDLFYIIKEGVVLCTKEGVEIRQMIKGDFFGEQALLYNSKRTATITCVGAVKVLCIGRGSLLEALGENLQQVIYRNIQKKAIEKSEPLKNLTKEQSQKMMDAMKIAKFSSGEVVVSKNSLQGSKLCIIMKGRVRGPLGVYETFSCIGDDKISQTSEQNNPENYIAETDADIAQISKEEFERCLGVGGIAPATNNNAALAVLKQVQLLRNLPKDRLKALLQVLRTVDFRDREAIVQENETGDTLYIVKTGKVSIFKDNTNVRTLTMHDYFGERSILFNERRSATVVAEGNVTCWTLEKNDFESIIDFSMRTQLLKRIELQDNTIMLDQLVMIKPLGKGMFGNVYLMTHKEKGAFYAMKTVPRSKIVAYNIHESLVLERKILLQLDHTMIVKLVKTFKDSKRIYFLMEYVRGIDLFDVLRQLGLLKEDDARFYTACLVVILEYLHKRDIIYRDLKPENIMIDEEGYPKLIDFGIAKIVNGRSYTTVGTPHYMAPEVIMGNGYNSAVDWWSLGIMIYEFVFGTVPFGENEEDTYKVYERVIEHNLIFPTNIKHTTHLKSIITQLLSVKGASRTGGSISKLKKHKFLAGFKWEVMFSRGISPPYVPKLRSLTSEAAKAFKSKKNFLDTILRDEISVETPIHAGKSKSSVPMNWDIEF
ncbi:unnamed protein product [Blepharisma stoltei]|uniref:cGMP-dependent protein kinase n=1 Tax=Blepharisma stoltei TaxID=1481888 RepID=A0AAU9J7S0_9CILI|nr:unnamed protein product [Blepharisma stoltei]